MQNKSLTLTIVIPAYNEERHLKACLDAVKGQSVAPNEVIVVDNNSTDKTAEIAKSYPFVTLIKESHQGRGYARTAGFNAANSEILGRIDADSVIAPNWVERVLKDFEDENVSAVTGLGVAKILPFLKWPTFTFWSRAYFWLVHAYFNCNSMWGANSALRKSVWLKVRDDTCLDDRQVHEDQDLSILIIGSAGMIIQDNKLHVYTNEQSYVYMPKYIYYTLLRYRTKARHDKLGTLNKPNLHLIGFWNALPGRIYASFFTLIFISVALIVWPFFILGKVFSKEKRNPWVNNRITN